MGGNDYQRRKSALADDHEIQDLAMAGLPASFVVRPAKIATIEARHAERLGKSVPATMTAIGEVLAGYAGWGMP